jgi:hypothetical protein
VISVPASRADLAALIPVLVGAANNIDIGAQIGPVAGGDVAGAILTAIIGARLVAADDEPGMNGDRKKRDFSAVAGRTVATTPAKSHTARAQVFRRPWSP